METAVDTADSAAARRGVGGRGFRLFLISTTILPWCEGLW